MRSDFRWHLHRWARYEYRFLSKIGWARVILREWVIQLIDIHRLHCIITRSCTALGLQTLYKFHLLSGVQPTGRRRLGSGPSEGFHYVEI